MACFSSGRVSATCLFWLSILVSIALEGAGQSGVTSGRSRPSEVVVRVHGFLPTMEASRSQATPAHGLPAPLSGCSKHLSIREGLLLSVADKNAMESTGSVGEQTWLLRLSNNAQIESVIAELKVTPGIVCAEPNYIGQLCMAPTDPLYPQASGDYALIGAEQAWDVQYGADPSVTVAVIDSGVDAYHEDIASALDTANSWNFPDGNGDVFDDIGHGTRVAGLIGAASDNSAGAAGLAHGCRLVSFDVANSAGEIALSDVIAAIDAAVVAGADVVNMSLGFRIHSQTLDATCLDALRSGVVLVASAGNEGSADALVYPALCDSVIGVAAVLDDGATRASWSNYNGPTGTLVELAAPGSTLFSTIPGSQYDGLYGSGTSFAAPLVSGAAALLVAHYPEMSAGAIRDHLRETARALGNWSGAGLVQAGDVLTAPMTPQITVDVVTVDDALALDPDNDGDGRLDEGETVDLSITLLNEGGDATTVTGVLTCVDPEVTLPATSVVWGRVNHNGSGSGGAPTSDTATFSGIRYTSVVPTTKDVDVHLYLTSDAYATTTTFTIRTENAYNPLSIIGTTTTWTADRTYTLEQNTIVMPGALLTIEPGTDVRFGPEGGLEIRGGLNAIGLEDDEIRFASTDDAPSGGYTSFRLPVAGQPVTAAVGDVDNDGDNDILTANVYDSPSAQTDLSCLLWNGVAFEPAIGLDVGNTAKNESTNLIVCDVDSDGVNEVIYDGKTFAWTTGSLAQTGTISIEEYRVARDLATTNTSSRWNYTTVVEDVNNDGWMDIASINPGTSTVDVLPWNGSSFDPTVSFSVSVASWRLCAGDTNNDGNIDLVTAESGMGTVSQYRWLGSGFSAAIPLPVGASPRSIHIADVDDDGDNDIAIGHVSGNELLIHHWSASGHETVTSLAAGNDTKNIGRVIVADLTGDSANDVLTANSRTEDVSVFEWDPDLSSLPKNQGIQLNPTAGHVSFSHCRFERVQVLDQSPGSLYTDCDFIHSGGAFALKVDSEATTYPIVRCTASGNDGGGGIDGGPRDLVDCAANDNAGTGLVGNTLTRCVGEGNGGAGMSGATVVACTALDNGADGIVSTGSIQDSFASGNPGWGVTTSRDITNTSATHNDDGIQGRHLTGCVAESNADVGLVSNGLVTDCRSADNGGLGVQGYHLTDCVILGNGRGTFIPPFAQITNSLIAENQGPGITGGEITSCVVRHNAAAGIASADSVTNSWIVGNQGSGIESVDTISRVASIANRGSGVVGLPNAPYTAINLSTITNNAASGVVSCGPVTQSNLYGNGESGYDCKELRPSSEVIQSDFRSNYWGPVTTPLMDAHPFGSYFDVPRIHDVIDDTNLAEVNYGGHLSSPVLTAWPDSSAPAFLLSVTLSPGPDAIASVGLTTFTLTFSETMNMAIPLSVTFGKEYPYATHIIKPVEGVGWRDDVTWQGLFSVRSDTGDGLSHLRVSGAVSDDGFLVPDDSAHTFTVDSSGDGGANIGVAVGRTGGRMYITWTDRNPLLSRSGFNVLRSQSLDLGSFRRVNPSPIQELEFLDTGLLPNTVYYYYITHVDDLGNTEQWTSIFDGETGPTDDSDSGARIIRVY